MTWFPRRLGRLRREGKTYFEPTKEAVDAFSQTCYDASQRGQKFYAACSPGWMNSEGKFKVGKTFNTAYPGGPITWDQTMAKKRAEGKEFNGFQPTLSVAG